MTSFLFPMSEVFILFFVKTKSSRAVRIVAATYLLLVTAGCPFEQIEFDPYARDYQCATDADCLAEQFCGKAVSQVGQTDGVSTQLICQAKASMDVAVDAMLEPASADEPVLDAGVECVITGVEACDGLDNDCDGRVDEIEGGEDEDADGVAGVCDLCPGVADPSQDDTDGDGVGDACDNCGLSNADQADVNENGIGDTCEGEPSQEPCRTIMGSPVFSCGPDTPVGSELCPATSCAEIYAARPHLAVWQVADGPNFWIRDNSNEGKHLATCAALQSTPDEPPLGWELATLPGCLGAGSDCVPFDLCVEGDLNLEDETLSESERGLGCNCDIMQSGRRCEVRRVFGVPAGFGPFTELEGLRLTCRFALKDPEDNLRPSGAIEDMRYLIRAYGDSHIVSGAAGSVYSEPEDLITGEEDGINGHASRNGGSFTITSNGYFSCLAEDVRAIEIKLSVTAGNLRENTKLRCSIDMTQSLHLRPKLSTDP